MHLSLYKHLFLLLVAGLLSGNIAYGQSKPDQPGDNKFSLEANRLKIDSVDNALIQLLGKRERIVKEIGIYKAKNNIKPLQPARFKQVLERSIEAGRKQGLSAEFVTELMNAIHKESLRIEQDSTITRH